MRTHVDLFTGLAGFALAAHTNGVRTIAMCEIDPHDVQRATKDAMETGGEG